MVMIIKRSNGARIHAKKKSTPKKTVQMMVKIPIQIRKERNTKPTILMRVFTMKVSAHFSGLKP